MPVRRGARSSSPRTPVTPVPCGTGTSPRVTVLNAYSHLATHWHRLKTPPEVIAGLPREKQVYFRDTWIADFRTKPATRNTAERFMGNDEPPISSDNEP